MRLVRSYGRAATSFQILTSDLKYWFADEGCLAYADVGDAWVAVGGAIAPPHREADVNEQFAREAQRRGKRVRFFAMEREVPSSASLTAIQIGEQPYWDPKEWPARLSKKLRKQLRRDRAKSAVTIRLAEPSEIMDPSSATRRGIDAVIAHWLDSRRMAPMEFLVQLNPYQLAGERRYFVAEHQGAVVAAMIALPVYARSGWFLETMVRLPDAPNGTIELIFDFAMRRFAAEGSAYVTFGLCPLTGGCPSVLAWIRRVGRSLYNFDGLRRFKGKLGPSGWEPVYLVYPKGDGALLAVVDALRAFLPGGFVRFGWRTLIQRARTVSGAIAALLVPWTLLLARADTARWFPSLHVKLGWVALDVVMACCFFALARRWSRTLAIALAMLTAFDFVASCAQLASYNAQRVTWLSWPITTIAVLGPLLAALFLWSSRNRHRLYVPREGTAFGHGVGPPQAATMPPSPRSWRETSEA